jgi:multidrug resistance efflux pump
VVAEEIAAAAAGPDHSYQHAVAQSEAAVREAEAEAEAAERAAERYSAVRPRPASGDLGSQIDDLAKLREAGVLSAEEFEAAKSRLLGG